MILQKLSQVICKLMKKAEENLIDYNGKFLLKPKHLIFEVAYSFFFGFLKVFTKNRQKLLLFFFIYQKKVKIKGELSNPISVEDGGAHKEQPCDLRYQGCTGCPGSIFHFLRAYNSKTKHSRP